MDKIPSMDEMIKACEDKVKPNEAIVFGFGVGRMIPMLGKRKGFERAMDLIKAQDGFLGVHPMDLWYNVLIFDTLNNAKSARNVLKSKGISVGQVVPLMIPKEYAGGDYNE